MSYFKEYKSLNLAQIHKEVLDAWKKDDVFIQSLNLRKDNSKFTFYEGPPSANGMPGIHHVIARTIKDLFCRYKTLQGFHVDRKAGWDTHGLPVELGVEKELNITKEDIGTTISIEGYNNACRKNVMKYQGLWEDITSKMGYWVDMKSPYITYDNKYIESVWWLIKELHSKKLLYKGFTVQPFSPKAGTGLSTHELNQPGCYKNVKDTSAIAQFEIIKNNFSEFLFSKTSNKIYFIAWTTTPWTLPSNTALGVGKKIIYQLIETVNQYTGELISVIVAKELSDKYFKKNNLKLEFKDYKAGDKELPFRIVNEFKGEKLEGLRYEQLLNYAKPEDGDAFKVILADFVTTEDGTGIVHLAPSFGSDDNLVAKQNKIGTLTLVNEQGKFLDCVTDFAGQYVKDEFYLEDEEKPKLSVDVQICVKLKNENKLFKSEKYEHSYPHCWRTDKPILYYPLDSWFIKTTEYKDRMIELNKTINWKPKSTGEGRFGNWLENLVDWNLSRSRFWGIPIPIWRTSDGIEEICIGSVEELKSEITRSINAGIMKENPLKDFIVNDFSKENYDKFDLHRPYVDDIKLVSKSGKVMFREIDLIDVWFDSGAMPYAQIHYPFENKDLLKKNFPADFIAEGVDQTRGWFFTLHAISTLVFDSVAYKNVVSNGLVLDKNGNKMSKRLGNAVDPFTTIDQHGADATRWYMIANAQPWDNLKFDESGIIEVQRKFFGTLYNTYSFFALYANIDNFKHTPTASVEVTSREEIDQWIISELNTLVVEVEKSYEDYEPTKVARLIQDFVINKLSNWHIRLSRRRFWKGEFNQVKKNAYKTVYDCLNTIAIISSPIAPFFMDKLYKDLNNSEKSVHLADFPKANLSHVNIDLEKRMSLAQKITSSILSIRKKEKIRVRQPLAKFLISTNSSEVKRQIEAVKNIILSETNVKEVEFINSDSGILTKKVKPNFKKLGPKFGKEIKSIVAKINLMSEDEINYLEKNSKIILDENLTLFLEDVEISSEDISGYSVSSGENYTVALDINISDKLKEEGLAREFVNRVQRIRKDLNFEVTDKISINVIKNNIIEEVIKNNLSYICNETLAEDLIYSSTENSNYVDIDLVENFSCKVMIKKY